MTQPRSQHQLLAFRQFFAASTTPAIVLDTSLEVVAINDAYLGLIDLSRQELLGTSILEISDDASPVDLSQLRASLEQVTHNLGEDVMPLQNCAGDGRCWSPTNLAVLDDHATLHWIIHRLDDATDEKARQRIEQLARNARQESRNKDRFLAMLGHELRNPMAAVSTAVYVLKNAAVDDLPEERLRWGLNIIDRQLRHLTRLVNDLLDVARINENRIELQRESLLVNDIIEHAVEMVRPLINKRGQQLDVQLADEPVQIVADRTRMTQVVSNLLNNAAKYTQAGGSIAISVDVEDRKVFITVEDNGKGISPALLPHVFELFKQAEVSLDRSEGGLGLGLTLVKKLVEMHSGSVVASSEGPGEGSCFEVELPTAEAAEDPLARTAGDELRLRTRRVLVVGEEADAVDSLAMLLRVEGHSVEVAHGGEEAIAKAATFKPHIVLLDLNLPVLDGYDVARRIRQTDGLGETTLVALTNYAHDSDRRRSEAADFAYQLVKPINHNRLRQVLNWIDDTT